VESSSHVCHTNCVRARSAHFRKCIPILSLALFVLMIRHSTAPKTLPSHGPRRPILPATFTALVDVLLPVNPANCTCSEDGKCRRLILAKAEWLELRGERLIDGRMRLASLLALESWGFVTPVLTVVACYSFDP
jgi:hypothetical protein